MRKLTYIFVLVFFITGCNKEQKNLQLTRIDLGKGENYKSFLWSDEKIIPAKAILSFDFNKKAKQDLDSIFIELELLDENGNTITQKDHKATLLVLGKEYPSGICKLFAKNLPADGTVDFALKYSLGANPGSYSGTIKVKDSNLDRIGNLPDPNNQAILEWTAVYDEIWNPLLKWVFWSAIALITFLFLRLTIIKRKLYPKFKGVVRHYQSPSQMRRLNFNNYRKVVLSNRNLKQTTFDKLWRGEILFIKEPACTDQIEFIPKGKGNVKYKFDPNLFSIQPADGFMQKGVEYKIIAKNSKQIISI